MIILQATAEEVSKKVLLLIAIVACVCGTVNKLDMRYE